MNTQIASRFAAIVFALMMNTLIIGGVASLFTGEMHQEQTVHSDAA